MQTGDQIWTRLIEAIENSVPEGTKDAQKQREDLFESVKNQLLMRLDEMMMQEDTCPQPPKPPDNLPCSRCPKGYCEPTDRYCTPDELLIKRSLEVKHPYLATRLSASILLHDAQDLIEQSAKVLPPEVEEKILVLINAASAEHYLNRAEIAKTHRALGDCYCKHGIYISALDQYQRALELYPKLPIKRRMEALEKLPDKTQKSSISPDIIKDVFIYPEYLIKCLNCSLQHGTDGYIREENLPYRIVYYPPIGGAFIGFQERLGEPVYLCECERKAVYGYLKLRQNIKKQNYRNSAYMESGFIMSTAEFPYQFIAPYQEAGDEDIGHLMSVIPFKPGLCHRCNHATPVYTYCHPMYGGTFTQKYGWYVRQKQFEFCFYGNDFIPDEECNPPGTYALCVQFQEECNTLHTLPESSSDPVIQARIDDTRLSIKELSKKIGPLAENMVREELGFKKVGESWTSETTLFHTVEHIFPDYNVHMHYRPDFLEGLEYDIFVDELNLAIEYQGIQHFKPVKHWGGEAALEKLKARDAKKKKISEALGVNLIYFNYDESIDEPYVRQKINAALN